VLKFQQNIDFFAKYFFNWVTLTPKKQPTNHKEVFFCGQGSVPIHFPFKFEYLRLTKPSNGSGTEYKITRPILSLSLSLTPAPQVALSPEDGNVGGFYSKKI